MPVYIVTRKRFYVAAGTAIEVGGEVELPENVAAPFSDNLILKPEPVAPPPPVKSSKKGGE